MTTPDPHAPLRDDVRLVGSLLGDLDDLLGSLDD